MTKPAKRRRERLAFRVAKGCLMPADGYTVGRLRERGYKLGDLLLADLVKPRNPKFNRLVHRLGQLVVANVEAFAGIEPHKAIKRLQIEGKVACDEIGISVPGYGMLVQLIPQSLSFESMDEGEYHAAAKGICRTVAERYWHDCTPEQIEQMAEAMIDE